MSWHHLSDSLSWSHGHLGRGYLLHDGTIKTWNVDPYLPTDQRERWEADHERSPIALNFDIDPDGGVVTESPTTKVKTIVAADPQLYDAGQRPVFEDDFDLDQFQPKAKPEGKPDMNFILSGWEGHAESRHGAADASPDELHVGLSLPKHITTEIKAWVDKQDWPDGTELEDPSEYHITLLYSPGGHKEHHQADWLKHTDGIEVAVSGLEEFGDEAEKAIVLRLDSGQAARHAERMQDQAEEHGLEITHFPGGYKPHITLAYGPSKPKGSPPKLRFTTGPSSVSTPRTSALARNWEWPAGWTEPDLHGMYQCPRCHRNTLSALGTCDSCGYVIPGDGARTQQTGQLDMGRSPGTFDMNGYQDYFGEPHQGRRTANGRHHLADYQGWTNWETWHTALLMDNDEPLYNASRKLVQRGGTIERLRDWAIRKVLGPYNKQQVADAQEWNAIPLEERQRMKRDSDIAQFGEAAVNLGEGLMKPFEDWQNEGKDEDEIRREQEYEAPDLIEPELVNWDEIYNGLKSELAENDDYDRDMQALRDRGLGWGTNHDEATNVMRDAMYRYHGAQPEDWFKQQGLKEYDDPRAYHNINVHMPGEHFQQIAGSHWPEDYLSREGRDKAWEVQQQLGRSNYDVKDWSHPAFQQVVNEDPQIQDILQNGKHQRLSDYTWDMISKIRNGQEHPYLGQMQEALTQRGYTPQQIQQYMQPIWQWDPELEKMIPINRQPPVQQWADTSMDEPGDLTIPEGWTASVTANSTGTAHFNRWTGKLCHCPWHGTHRQTQRHQRFAGEHINKLRKAPDKAYKTPEGQEFIDRLLNHHPSQYESLFPYLAHRFKKGDIGLNQRPHYPHGLTWDPYGGEPLTNNLDFNDLARWHQWYEARQHPTRRGVNVMDKDFTPADLDQKAREHQLALRHERERKEMLALGKTVHKFRGAPGGGIAWDRALEESPDDDPQRAQDIRLLEQNEGQVDPRQMSLLQERDGRPLDPYHDPDVHGPGSWSTPEQQQQRRDALQELHHELRHEYGIPDRPPGWHIKHLNARQNDAGDYNDIERAMEAEGAAMEHCIGTDEQPYKQNAVNGDINAYSLRDAKGEPHATWHYNSDGSLAEMFGPNDDPIKEEYQDMLNEWGQKTGHDVHPDQAVGHQEEAEDPQDEYFTFPAAYDVDDYIRFHDSDNRDYDYAEQHGNIGDETYFENEPPNWDRIARDYLSDGAGRNADHFHSLLDDNGHEEEMADALRYRFDPEAEDERSAIESWNANVHSHRHEIDLPQPNANEVDKYNEAVDNGDSPEPDDWDALAQDYLTYPEHYAPGPRDRIPSDGMKNQYMPYGKSEYEKFHEHIHPDSYGNHEQPMGEALQRNIDWENPDHVNAIGYWNNAMPHNVVPDPPSPPAPLPGQQSYHWPEFWHQPDQEIKDWGGYTQEPGRMPQRNPDPYANMTTTTQTLASVIPDARNMLSPATELREWLADLGGEAPAPSIHHADESDFIQAPAVSTADDLPYYPPAHIPKELKQSMAERSGDPQLDAAIAEFMSQHRGELGGIQDYRHPQVAWGQCELVSEECAQFLQARGFKAYKTDSDLDELGYQNAQKSEDVGAGDFTYPEHSVVAVYNEHGIVWWTIDFTAAQYGFSEFPKVEPGPPGPLIGPQTDPGPTESSTKTADAPITQADATNDPLGKNPAIIPSRQGDPDYLQAEHCPGCHHEHRPDEPCPDSAVRQYQQMERAWYNTDSNAIHSAPDGLTDHQADLSKTASVEDEWDDGLPVVEVEEWQATAKPDPALTEMRDAISSLTSKIAKIEPLQQHPERKPRKLVIKRDAEGRMESIEEV